MERIVINTIRKSNAPFIKNATTLLTEYPPFLPYFDFRKGLIKYINDEKLLKKQAKSEEGFENPYYTLRSIFTKYGNAMGAYSIKATFSVKIERKVGEELKHVEGYNPTDEELNIQNPPSVNCPECQKLIEAINAGKKAFGSINLNNTSLSDPTAILESKNKAYNLDIEISINNKNFNLICAEPDILWDKLYKINMFTIKTFESDTNAVKNYLNNMTEYIKETIENQVTGTHDHYLLEYVAETVTNEIQLLCYKLTPGELGSYLDREFRIAPIYKTDKAILWIPIRYTKQPFLNAIRGVGRTGNISENYVDTVIGNIRIRKEDRVNNLEYVEHHNEINWLEKVGFSQNKDEILLYIK